MGRPTQDTTAARVAAGYEAIVALGDRGALGERAAQLRADFQRRTGAFGPEDPWFDARAGAFWDDALAGQGFATAAAAELDDDTRALARCVSRAHRGFFVVDDVDDDGARLVDVWSGAELAIRLIDESQSIALEHAEGAIDARVTATPSGEDLYLLPGAYHHTADALEPAMEVLAAAKERKMTTVRVLDALMRMDLVLRSSSRVKAAFAYRVESLERRT